MIAIRARYNEGHIELLEPMPSNVTHAQLNIVVIPDEELFEIAIPATEYVKTISNGEKDFKNIGIHSFFNTEEDSNADWEEIFGIKEKQI